MTKNTFSIKGMHCSSCELLVEDEVKKVAGVEKVRVDFRKGEAVVESVSGVNEREVAKAVKEAGYAVGTAERLPWWTRSEQVQQHLIASLSILVIGFFVLNYFGVFDLQTSHQAASSSLPVIFIVGLTAGFSTCMALIGGLVLGISSRFAQTNRDASALAKFRPHMVFNIGRVVSYFVLGGVIGWIGSFFTLSSITIGVLMILVSVAMVMLGLQLTEVSPRLAAWRLTLPSSVARMMGIRADTGAYSDRGTAMMGALTFFLPCGFTQTMQLYALSVADPLRAAMIMGVFALGTTPGLLGIGGITALVKGAFAQAFFRFAGVLVVAFALFNAYSGWTLVGWSFPTADGAETTVTEEPTTGEVQVLKATYTLRNGMEPQSFNVKAGVPVRLEVDVKENGVGCMATMLIPGVNNTPRFLKAGEVMTFAFTPKGAKTFNIVCAMGLPHGEIVAS